MMPTGFLRSLDPESARPAHEAATMHRSARSRARVLLLAAIISLQSGCSDFIPPPRPRTEYQPDLGQVGIVALVRAPEIELKGIAESTGEGAARGAGSYFTHCVDATTRGTGPFIILGIAVCGIVVAPVGAIVGGATAPDAREVSAVKRDLVTALEIRTIQETLLEKVTAAALGHDTQLLTLPAMEPDDSGRLVDYRPFARKGVDTVLEVALTKAGFRSRDALALMMEARVRLVRTRDNEEIFSADYVHNGGERPLEEWSANQAELVIASLNAGYEALGALIYDNIFLLYPFPDRKNQLGLGIKVKPAFGLAPVEPSNPNMIVDSLQPTLHWQRFPRSSDIDVAPHDMRRVTNVTYDLVIARGLPTANPLEVVYRREGIRTNEHKVETPLAAESRFFWAVRARFELEGRERVTEWSTMNEFVRERFTAPSPVSYRFSTP